MRKQGEREWLIDVANDEAKEWDGNVASDCATAEGKAQWNEREYSWY